MYSIKDDIRSDFCEKLVAFRIFQFSKPIAYLRVKARKVCLALNNYVKIFTFLILNFSIRRVSYFQGTIVVFVTTQYMYWHIVTMNLGNREHLRWHGKTTVGHNQQINNTAPFNLLLQKLEAELVSLNSEVTALNGSATSIASKGDQYRERVTPVITLLNSTYQELSSKTQVDYWLLVLK